MGWIVGKPIKVKRDGRTVPLKPGDPVPEAAHFRNRKAWVKSGHIRFVKDETPAPSGRKDAEPKETPAELPTEKALDTKPADMPPALEEKKPRKKPAAKKKTAKKKVAKKKVAKKKKKKE